MAISETTETVAIFNNNAATFGLIMGVLGLIFYTSSRKQGFWHSFYTHIPAIALLFCAWFIKYPGIL